VPKDNEFYHFLNWLRRRRMPQL